MALAALFYGITTFEGSFMAIRAVNSLSHYTDWTVGHVHAGALGWVAMITFGSIYALVPSMWKRPGLYSSKLVEVHFWLALSGTVIYVFAMWNSGVIQGLMWRTNSESGTLSYSFVDGLLFLLGAIVALYNVVMTIRMPAPAHQNAALDIPHTALAAGE
jgi:cytochrome c oxidase cbb3-type subunit 1